MQTRLSSKFLNTLAKLAEHTSQLKHFIQFLAHILPEQSSCFLCCSIKYEKSILDSLQHLTTVSSQSHTNDTHLQIHTHTHTHTHMEVLRALADAIAMQPWPHNSFLSVCALHMHLHGPKQSTGGNGCSGVKWLYSGRYAPYNIHVSINA